MPTNPEESLKKLEKLEKECLDRLRKTAIEIQIKKEQKTTDSDDSLEMRNLIESYDDSLEMYLPVLMTYAKYYWDKRDYQAVEKLFR